MADTRSSTGMPLPDAVAGNFQEAVRWFNQMWGGAGDAARSAGPIPSVLMPTLDIKELDKRIADLRSVEHWLQLNQGLLKTTIQGLEMQRNTLSAWQSFGAAAAGAGAASATSEKPHEAAGASEAPPFQPAMWWAALQQQFAQMAAAAAAGEPAAANAPASAPGRAATPPAQTPPGSTAGKAASGKGRGGASGAG